MKQCLLNENNHPKPLPVILSRRVRDEIQLIRNYNQDKINEIKQWKGYINAIIKHIGNNSIAFDYSGHSYLLPNKTKFNNELGYGIGYKILIDATGCAFVFVFMLNLNLNAYGLKKPHKKNIKQITLTEDKLCLIIKDVIERTLLLI